MSLILKRILKIAKEMCKKKRHFLLSWHQICDEIAYNLLILMEYMYE